MTANAAEQLKKQSQQIRRTKSDKEHCSDDHCMALADAVVDAIHAADAESINYSDVDWGEVYASVRRAADGGA